jgi:predicted acylesterase/phospholipase RssA
MNGGVSLAVWIGGVTHEIDAARTTSAGAEDDKDISVLYQAINKALQQHVVVDVIAGASAGGINGVALGAAIFKCKPLANLRETWIRIGDFRTLLRPAAQADPPSLMKGDDVVLTELRSLLAETYGEGNVQVDRNLYVYVTATDLFGYERQFEDSTGRRFSELDHRRVFGFVHETEADAPKPTNGALNTTIWLGASDAPELLARAARSSSSFPVAFEPHSTKVVDADGTREHWLVDGGILDNQPFNPVLDRIAVLPATCPVRRVVMYVVPYVTEVHGKPEPLPQDATARDTYAASGKLPRDLPKLIELERVTTEEDEQRVADAARARLSPLVSNGDLKVPAERLFDAYRDTRRAAAAETFQVWASRSFRPGAGVLGNDPAVDAATIMAATPTRPVDPTEEARTWIPEALAWPNESSSRWSWGLSPAERLASLALLFLGDAAADRRKDGKDDSALDVPRKIASELVWEVRTAKELVVTTFRRRIEEGGTDAMAVAIQSYGELDVVAKLKKIEDQFRKLDEQIENGNKGYGPGATGYAPQMQELIHFEVVQNAFSIDQLQVPFPFKFIFASAGIRNSLNHQADTPAKKLAGLKLNHFAGFLKRSWRANDWLWGRLDGVEHVLRAIVDLDRVDEVGPGAVTALATAAFPPSTFDREVLLRAWEETLAHYGIEAVDEGEAAFESVLRRALAERNDNPPKAERYLAVCRHALAAPIQLRILDKELIRVAETARDDIELGASPIANGAYWYGRVLERQSLDDARRVELFHDLRIGEETVEDESSSRLAFDVGSQGAAVAAALFAGDRGGLPSAARGALGSARGITLASSRLIQLLARAPAVGAAVFFVLVGLTLWAATARSTLVGALLPTLAILTVVLGVAALTLATSVYENSLAKVPRLLGFGVIAGAPLAFALLFRWPKWWHYGADKLDSHVGKTGVTIAAALGALAFLVAFARLVVGAIIRTIEKHEQPYGRSWRRVVMGFYRWPIVGALLTLACGFSLERIFDRMNAKHASWVGVAAERRGTILVLALLATLLLAALLQEVLVPVFVWTRWHVLRPAWAWVKRNTLIAWP